MPDKVLTQKDMERLRANGAEVETHAQLVDSPTLIAAMKEISAAQLAATQAGQEKIMSGLERLIETIAEKQIGSDVDLSELVAAVGSLQQQVVIVNEPADYVLTFDRDRRNLIDGSKGLRFTTMPKDVN